MIFSAPILLIYILLTCVNHFGAMRYSTRFAVESRQATCQSYLTYKLKRTESENVFNGNEVREN